MMHGSNNLDSSSPWETSLLKTYYYQVLASLDSDTSIHVVLLLSELQAKRHVQLQALLRDTFGLLEAELVKVYLDLNDLSETVSTVYGMIIYLRLVCNDVSSAEIPHNMSISDHSIFHTLDRLNHHENL